MTVIWNSKDKSVGGFKCHKIFLYINEEQLYKCVTEAITSLQFTSHLDTTKIEQSASRLVHSEHHLFILGISTPECTPLACQSLVQVFVD